jgi:hypothetical protein
MRTTEQNMRNVIEQAGRVDVRRVSCAVHVVHSVHEFSAILAVLLSTRCVVSIANAGRTVRYGRDDPRISFVDVERTRLFVALFGRRIRVSVLQRVSAVQSERSIGVHRVAGAGVRLHLPRDLPGQRAYNLSSFTAETERKNQRRN